MFDFPPVFLTEDMQVLHHPQTLVRAGVSRKEGGGDRFSLLFASLLGDAVCWLGLRRGEERRGEERQDGGRGESAQPDSSACCCIDEKKLQSGDVRATRKKER